MNNLPVTLVLVGLVVALTKLAPPISLTHDAAFYLILPPILFLGGMHLNLEHLRRDWKSILLLAVPGVVVSTLLIGYLLSATFGIVLFSIIFQGFTIEGLLKRLKID